MGLSATFSAQWRFCNSSAVKSDNRNSRTLCDGFIVGRKQSGCMWRDGAVFIFARPKLGGILTCQPSVFSYFGAQYQTVGRLRGTS